MCVSVHRNSDTFLYMEVICPACGVLSIKRFHFAYIAVCDGAGGLLTGVELPF